MARLRPTESWRDYYNPVRNLSLAQIQSMEDSADRGQHADVQWLYHHMRLINSTVLAAETRRLAYAETLEWQIRTTDDASADPALAEEQRQFLAHAYNRIVNMREATKALAGSVFRGFAHLQKIIDPATGLIRRLDYIPQWYWVRDKKTGRWKFNPKSMSQTEGEEVDPKSLLVATSTPLFRPISRLFYAMTLCHADWDTALETGANPNLFFIAPPGQDTEEKMQEFQTLASQLATNGRGALQNGAEIRTFDPAARARLPYLDRAKYCEEQIVLTATGGMLTMLTQSGSGTLAGGAHSESLMSLARSDAAMLSEVFQKHVDAQLLKLYFPGQPALAYFAFEVPSKQDPNQLLEAVANLSWAQLTVDPDWLAEKTGMKIIPLAPQAPQ